MNKKIIYLCACAVAGLMLTTSCQDSLETDSSNSNTRSVIIDKNVFAVKGRINVKLTEAATRAIPATRSGKIDMQSVSFSYAFGNELCWCLQDGEGL